MIPEFHNKDISAKIKAKFGLNPYSWQVNIIANIVHYKKDVFIIAGTNARKNLTYQSLFEVTEGIILVISPIIALIEDQMQWLCQQGISVMSFILILMVNNLDIWRHINKIDDSVVFGLPKVLFSNHSPFWQQTMQN